MAGKEQRLPRYAGRRGDTLFYKGNKVALDYFADDEDAPDWKDLQDETPPARRTATTTQDHDFRARR